MVAAGMGLRFDFAQPTSTPRQRSICWTTLPGSPPTEDRYAEERELFGFFANAVAAIESCCFAIYHVGLMAQPPFFAKPPDEVTLKATATAVANAFPGTRLAAVLAHLNGDAAWREVKQIRNIFMQQASSPGRTVYVSLGAVAAGYEVPPAASCLSTSDRLATLSERASSSPWARTPSRKVFGQVRGANVARTAPVVCS
jgi:hypothetical protein